MTYLSEMKILYIEDDTETREALNRFLRRRCSKVTAVSDAESGLEIYETYNPDIIIVDLLLPGINGMDFIDRINKMSVRHHSEILITTTVSEVDTVIGLIDRNISAYVIKPLDMNALEEKLQMLAAKIHDSSINKSRHAVLANDDNRGQIADNIRVDFLKLLKSKSGKGPTKVNVILKAETVEILAYDTLTAFEKTIIENNLNSVLLEQVRQLFYKNIKSNIEQIVLEKTGLEFTLEKIDIDVYRKVDYLELELNNC